MAQRFGCAPHAKRTGQKIPKCRLTLVIFVVASCSSTKKPETKKNEKGQDALSSFFFSSACDAKMFPMRVHFYCAHVLLGTVFEGGRCRSCDKRLRALQGTVAYFSLDLSLFKKIIIGFFFFFSDRHRHTQKKETHGPK
nr:hypothetical protein [Pandoravirus aubagnensis]